MEKKYNMRSPGGDKKHTYWADVVAPYVSSGRCIVYVDFVEDVVPLALKLKESFGLKTGSYYGRGLSGHDKDEVLQSWRSGVIQVMVATTAFGLGVNQPDVETVVRVGVPPTMEELVQEFGRAGRDGRKAKGVKRLMREAIELKDPTPMYFAQPLEENLFEWHFTIQGPQGTEFESGRYHGRILLPTEYPMKPPSIIMLTPNGRFELHQKICLSASAYHPELWQPSWSIRTVLLAIIGFMPTEGVGAIGSMDCPAEERRRMARRSLDWVCPICGVPNKFILPQAVEGSSQEQAMEEAANIVTQMAFKSEDEVKRQKQSQSQKASSEAGRTDSSEKHNATQAETNPDSRTNPTPLREGNRGTSESLRPRHVTAVQQPVTRGPTPGHSQRAHGSQRQSSNGVGSIALILVLLLAIVILLARRAFRMAKTSLE